MGLPLIEGFEHNTTLPECWIALDNIDAADPAIVTYPTAAVGTRSLSMTSGPDMTTHAMVVASHRLTQSPSGVRMRLKLRTDHSNAKLRVGVCTTGASQNSYYNFTPVETLTIPSVNTWIQYEVDFGNYSGNGDRIAFMMHQSDQPGVNTYIYIDDISVERCAVETMSVSHLTSNSMQVAWTMMGSGTVNMRVSTTNGNVVYQQNGVSSPHTVSGLQSSTTYRVTLIPQCTGESNDGISKETTATTLGGNVQGLAYCEGFEGMPSTWVTSGTAAASTTRSYSGGRSLYLSNGDRAVLPMLDVESLGQLMMNMRMYASTASSRLAIRATDYPLEANEGTLITTLSPSVSGIWEAQSASLAGYTGTAKYLVLTATAGSVFIDDLQVGRCLLSGVAVHEVSANSVTLEWNTPSWSGGNIKVVRGSSVSTVDASQCTTVGNKTRYTISGLQPGQNYTFEVYADCDPSHCSSTTVQAQTYAASIAMPYCQSFDNYTSGAVLPSNWQATTQYNGYPKYSSTQSHSGSYALQMAARGNVNGSHSVVCLPPMNLTANAKISFSTYTSYSGCTLQVGTLTDPQQESTFNPLTTINVDSYEWSRHVVSLGQATGNGVFVAIRMYHNGSNDRYVWLDDIEVNTTAIGDVEIYGQRASGATIGWTASGCNSVTLYYAKSNQTTLTPVNNPSNPYTFTGLNSGTTYKVYLQGHNQDGDGCQVYVGTFSTNFNELQADYCHTSTISLGNNSNYTFPYLEETSYNNLFVSFDRTGSGTVSVGLRSSETDATTFTQVASGNGSHVRVSLQGHEADGHYICLQTTGGSATLNNLRIARSEITGFAAGEATSTTLPLSWSRYGTSDSVVITYTAGSTTRRVSVGNATQHTLTSLNPGTTYTITINTYSNGSHNQCVSQSLTATTLDADIASGWCEDFTGWYYSLPTGWATVQEGYGSVVSSGSLSMQGSSSTDAIVALPTSPANIGGLMLRADVWQSSGTPAKLVVGVISNRNAPSTFTPLDTLYPSTSQRSLVADLRAYTGTVRTLALRSIGTATVYIDNMSLLPKQVGNLRISEETNRSLKLRWEGADSATIVVKQGNTTVRTLTSGGHQAVINNLSANTAYTLRVIAAGITSAAECHYQTISGRTLPYPMELPLCLSMDEYNSSNQLPYGWSRLNDDTYPQSTTSPHTEGSRAIVFTANSSHRRVMLISPMFETPLAYNYLRFSYYNSNSYGTFEVGTLSDPTDSSTFAPIATLPYSNSWTDYEVTIGSLASSRKYLAFRLSTNYNTTNAYLDHLMLQSCPMPTAYVSHPEATSMQVHWSGGNENGVWIEYGTGSTYGTPVLATTSPYTLTGLSPNTSYNLRIWPACSTSNPDFECHKISLTQRTLPPPSSFPHCTGDYNTYTLNSNYSTDIVMPRINATGTCTTRTSVLFSFEYTTYNSNTSVQIGYITDQNDPTSFVLLESINLDYSSSYTEQYFSVPVQAMVSGFLCIRCTSGSATLRKLCVRPCIPAGDAEITAATYNSITVTWDNNDNSSLSIAYTAPDGTSGNVVATTSPYTLTGLTPNAHYTFTFTASCDCGLFTTSTEQSLQLPAAPVAAPVCHNFDDITTGTYPATWRITRNNSSTVNTANVATTQAASGTRSLDFYTSSNSNTLILALDPLPDTTATVVVGFSLYSSSESATNNSSFSVGIMSDPEAYSSFSNSQPVSLSATDTWCQYYVPVTLAAGKRHIALRRQGVNSVCHLYLDNLSLSRGAVSSLHSIGNMVQASTVGSVSTIHLQVYNNQSQTTRSLSITPTGAGPYSWTFASLGLSTDSSYTLTATAADQPQCNAQSIQIGSRLSLPYCEDFSSLKSLQPTEWQVQAHNSIRYPRIDNGLYHMYPDATNPTDNDLVLLPELPLGTTLADVYLKLDLTTPNYAYTYLEVGYLTSNGFTSLTELHNSTATAHTHHVSFAGCNATALALRARSTNGMRNLYIDNLQITTYPEPSTVTLGHTGFAYQHLYWDSTASSRPYYKIEYGLNGFTPGSGTLVTTDSCHALLGPLTANRTYQYYFLDTLGNRYCQPWQFSSMPAAQSISYCDNSTQSVNTTAQYVLPEVDADVSTLTLVLTYRTNGSLAVGVRSDRDLPSSYIPLDTLPSTAGAEHRIDLSLSNYTGSGRFITFQAIGGTATITQLTLQQVPQAHFRAVSSSSVEADIAAYADTNFYIEVRRTNGSLVATHHVTHAPYLINGLQPYTDYTFTCRDAATTCAPSVQVRTHLDISVPYCANASANEPGWYTSGDYTVLPYALVDHLYDLFLTLTSRGNMVLGAMSTLDDTTTFVPLDTLTSATWQQQEISLSPYAALISDRHYIAFRGGELQSLYLNLCPTPTATLSAFNTVRFDQPGTTHDYYIHYGSHSVHATTSPYYLSGLEQNTLYSFTFTCAASDQSCMPSVDILTGVQIAPPHCADLTGYRFSDGTLPAGWFTLVGSAGSRYAILPIIDLDSVSRLFGRVNYRIGQSGTQLSIGVMTDPTDESTFSPIATLGSTSSADYADALFNLSAYEGNGLYIALRSAGSNPGLVFLDRIELQTVPYVTYQLVNYNTVLVQATDGQPYTLPIRISDGNATHSFSALPALMADLQPDHTYHFTTSAPGSNPCIGSTPLATTHPLDAPACSGSFSLSATQPFALGPELTEADISTLRMQLRLNASAEGLSIAVGTLRIGNADTSFTPLDTLYALAANQWDTLQATFARHTPSEGRFLAFRLIGTGSASISLLSLDHCLLPSLSATLLRHNLVSLTADDSLSQRLYLEYTPQGGTTTVMAVDSLPLLLTLSNSTTYSFALRCDSAVANCQPKATITTLAPPPPLAWCEDFNSRATNQTPSGWPLCLQSNSAQDIHVVSNRSHSSSRSLYFKSILGRHNAIVLPDMGLDSLNSLSLSLWMYTTTANAYAEVGVIYNPADIESFVPLRTLVCSTTGQWQRQLVDLSDAPHDAYFIAIRCNGLHAANQFWIDDIHISQCGANHMAVAQVEANQVSLQWRQTGSPSIAIQVIPEGGDAYTVQVPDSNLNGLRLFTIDQLSPLTNYRFVFQSSCTPSTTGYCTTNYTDTATLFTPAGGTGCIDPTNLIAAYTSCFYGSYANPYANQGVLDYGYASAASRHTVHYNLSELDPRTGGGLHTVPEGASASVRLGNWSTSGLDPTNPDPGQAESIVYSLFVDTLNFDLLIMRYAAVLQDMNHPVSKQPRFSLELLDEDGQLLDATCGRADFIANYMLGWNEADNDVLWKDWTTVGIDLTPYAGRTIRISLTTRDCSEGSHYGYAYFTLECMRKSIVASGCGVIQHNDLTAPSGFNYRWYTSESNTTYSTDQTITVASNNDITYYCDLSFVDNPTCQFTMSAFAGTRFPLSLFDYEVQLEPCSFVVSFHNHSTISMDGTNPVGTGEQCETALWDFGNGDSSDLFHPVQLFTQPGTYNVSLTSTIAGRQCAHTQTVPITLAFPPTNMRLEGPTDRCINQPTDTLHLYNVANLPSAGDWQLAASHGTVADYYLVADSSQSRTYTISAVDSVGCTTQFSHHISVHPTFDHTDQAHICTLLLPYSAWSDTTFQPSTTTGLYTQHKHSQHGCDSIVRLDLHVYDNATYTQRDTTRAATCDNRAYFFSDSLLTPTSTATIYYTDSLYSSIGCDSLSTIVLTVHPTFDHHTYDTICSNQSTVWGGVPITSYGLHTDSTTSRTTTSATYPLSLQSVHHCDSLSTLHLSIHPAYLFTTYDTICDDTTRLFQSSSYNTTGTYSHPYTSVHACDSTRSLALKVYPTYDLHLQDTIYDGDTYTFEATTYDTTGIYPHMLHAVFGCDSLRTLHLQRNRRTFVDTIVCYNTLPLQWNHIGWTLDASRQHGRSVGNWTVLRDSVHLSGQAGIDSLVVMSLIVRDTSSTTDVVHSCDSFYWNNTQTLYYTSTTTPAVRYTQLRHMPTTGLAQQLPPTRYEPWSHHLSTGAQCDSVRHLDLVVDYTHYLTDTQLACDSMQWRNHPPYYYRDTLGIVGPLGSHLSTGPVDTLRTVGGCDSVVNLDLSVHYSTYHCDIDTFCFDQTYSWRTRTIGSTGYFTDTLQTVWQCDSVRAIQLTQMPKPGILFTDSLDCAHQWHYLQATPDSSYYTRWSSTPADPTLSGQEGYLDIIVGTAVPTTYYLRSDFHRAPLCPHTDSIRLVPIVVPTAKLKTNPEALSYDRPDYNAYDITTPTPVWRHWYINHELQPDQSVTYSGQAPTTSDTVAIALEVFNGQCMDTAIVLIPMLRVLITAPNAFTPTLDQNNRFRIFTQGVVEADLRIFNREGLLVYRTSDLQAGWDGRRTDGTPCPQAAYVWQLTYRSIDHPETTQSKVGTITLLR